MNYTRIDSKKLTGAVARVLTLLSQVDDALDELTVLLTTAERTGLSRPREGFVAAARSVAESSDLDELKAAVGYDSESVLEDLANVETVSKVDSKLEKIKQRLDDSRLLWLAEASAMSLELYGVAKARAKVDAVIAKAIEPLVSHLSTPRTKKG